MYTIKINGQKFMTTNQKVTGQQVLEIAELEPVENYELLLKLSKKEFEPIQLDEIVDLENKGIETFRASSKKQIKITVDDEPVLVSECFMTPNEILNEAGFNPTQYYLKQLRGNKEISYKKEEDANQAIALRNNLKFTTCKIASTTVSNYGE